MSKARILQRLHSLGLNSEQAFEALYAIREDVVAEITHAIWRFREEKADRLVSPYAAMTNLMGAMRDIRYGDEDRTAMGAMNVVYIAHPIGGDIEANLADLRRIVRVVNHNYPNVVPFVPYYADCVSLDDNDQGDRRRGIRNDQFLLKSGIVDEVWLTGDRVSAGMEAEKALALHLGIPIVSKIGEL